MQIKLMMRLADELMNISADIVVVPFHRLVLELDILKLILQHTSTLLEMVEIRNVYPNKISLKYNYIEYT